MKHLILRWLLRSDRAEVSRRLAALGDSPTGESEFEEWRLLQSTRLVLDAICAGHLPRLHPLEAPLMIPRD